MSRLPPVLLISLLAGLCCSSPALAISFQARLEQAAWSIEGDRFECRLSQPIEDFGSGEFVRRAGEQVTFRLRVGERWLGPGSATLLAAAAPWQPERSDISLGPLAVGKGEVPLHSSQEQGSRLLAGLLEGRSPLVRHRTLNGGDSLEVRLLPVRFREAYADYLKCTAGLLPVNFEQIRLTQLGFPGGVVLEPLAQAKLDIILDFIKADPSINHFELDGHSDNSGNRLSNRDLSRRRAQAVQDYLIANGVPADQIVMRFHGERYPLVKNSSQANRALNRRVTLSLSRVSPATAEAPVSEAPASPLPAGEAADGAADQSAG